MNDFEICVALYPPISPTGTIYGPAFTAWEDLCDRLDVRPHEAQRAAIKVFDPQLADESGVS
jgi:hypothetical protein